MLHRQQEDLIKKIDFKQELLDSLDNETDNDNQQIQVNISALLDDNHLAYDHQQSS